MRQNFFILIIAAFISSFAMTRQPINQVTITSFIIKKKMTADISSWAASAALTLSAQKNPQSNVGDVKFTVQIRQGNLKICGNNVQNATLTDLKPLRSFLRGQLLQILHRATDFRPVVTRSVYNFLMQTITR